MSEPYTLYHGDCLDVLPTLAPDSADAVICDPPYGTTACKWDSVIPFAPMWAQLKRIIKPKGAIVLFGSQPFTSALVMSNVEWFKYAWVWNKKLAGNGILADVQPLKIHEDIVIFAHSGHKYNPQKLRGVARYKGGIRDIHGTFNGAENTKTWNDIYHPISILDFSGASMRNTREHPTQKPLALLEYLVKTYTNLGDTVLDFTFGSGTCGHACGNLGRSFIGIEKDAVYFELGRERIATAYAPLRMMEAV